MSFLLHSDIDEIVKSLGDSIQAFAGKRILITGARGFLGRYFTDVFLHMNATALSEPCEIIALDNLLTSGELGTDLPSDPHFAFVRHDVIKPFYPERPVQYIIHAAGIASPFYYRKWPLETLEVATTGLKNILEIATQHSAKVLFFSSSEIYGNPDPANVPTRESYNGSVSCLGVRACYDESKRLGETLVRIFVEKFGTHASIVRPFNVFGPGMQKLDYRVLPNFAARILANKPVTVYGDGTQTRTFCYVTDAICGFFKVLLEGESGEPYNIGNPTPELSILDLVKTIQRVLPHLNVQFHVGKHPDTYPSDEPLRRCPDITKAMIQLGYKPTINLDEGLKRFFSWSQDNY